MSSSKIDGRAARTSAATRRDELLITRAAKRTDWAGSALESAAGDLEDAHGSEGTALTGLTEVVLEEAARVSHLAEDIESHRATPDDGESDNDVNRPGVLGGLIR